MLFAPYRDGELPNSEEPRRFVAEAIRATKPEYVFTHWKNSLHRDHANTHSIVRDAVLLASLGAGAHRGVRAVWYAENWEDREGFRPFLYLDATGSLERWKEVVGKYQLFRGGVVSYPYVEYYEALARVRGAEAGKKYAVAFEVESYAKKRVLEALP